MKPGIHSPFKLYPNEARRILSKRIIIPQWPELDMIRVARYAVDMHDGNWDFTREDHPMTLDRNDLVMEGLHRFTAVTMLGKPAKVYLVKTT